MSKAWKEKLSQSMARLGKLKYPLLILGLGAILLLLPGKPDNTKPAEPEAPTEAADSDCEARLEEILAQVQGAGRVKVMLTVAAGPETIYQQDSSGDTERDGDRESSRTEENTVLISRGSGTEEPVVSQILAPNYCGAIVVCQGADDARVKLALVQAVCSVTGLGADQVTVLKMK